MSQISKREEPQQASPQKQEEKSQDSEDQVDFDPDSPNQKFFNLKDLKPFDLKAQWLGNTHEVISKFQAKMEELNKEKTIMKQGFQRFAENQSRFRISSLRKINFQFDKKALYVQFMKRSRKTIEKLHPSLIISIYSYIHANVFLAMAKMRRVSRIFNFIFKNDQVVQLFSVKDFGDTEVSLQSQVKWCKRYVSFCDTFVYYKEIKYSVLIPQNSIKEDLQRAVDFINEIYKRVYHVKSLQIGYFQMINNFMKHHRAAIALQSLSFADLAVTRKAAIIAFSNYLAFNPPSRLKEEITKTKYLKMIQLVEGEDCHDALVVNSRISNFLIQSYNYEFAVFVDTLKSASNVVFAEQPAFDLVVFHYHNPLRSFFAKEVVLQNLRIQVSGVSLEFSEGLKGLRLGYNLGERWQSEYLKCHYMPTVGEKGKFGHCYIYRSEFYFILIIKAQESQQ